MIFDHCTLRSKSVVDEAMKISFGNQHTADDNLFDYTSNGEYYVLVPLDTHTRIDTLQFKPDIPPIPSTFEKILHPPLIMDIRDCFGNIIRKVKICELYKHKNNAERIALCNAS